ncbi:MAG: chemotaxis protein CheW [Desulfomonile sp.]|jgi:purine-binding chemotaxis protein CheW
METTFSIDPRLPGQVLPDSQTNQFVVFHLDERQFGLKLSVVQRVIRAVEVTPVPNALELVLGLINMQGQLIYVVDTRKLLDLPEREIDLTDQFIIANSSGLTVALVVDRVAGVRVLNDYQMNGTEEFSHTLDHIYAVAKIDGEVVLILNVNHLLPPAQIRVLD